MLSDQKDFYSLSLPPSRQNSDNLPDKRDRRHGNEASIKSIVGEGDNEVRSDGFANRNNNSNQIIESDETRLLMEKKTEKNKYVIDDEFKVCQKDV